MVSAKNVSKTFLYRPSLFSASAKQTKALVDVTLEIASGDIVALVGRNGTGKTTLLKILCTLVLPDSGAVSIAGEDAIAHPVHARRLIGFAGADERSFYWRLTGQQNLSLFATLHDIKPSLIRNRVNEVLDFTDMRSHADTPFRFYSSGMKQRLALARCLLHDPPALILDEPSKGLDPLSQSDFFDFIKNKLVRERGKTVLFATHNLNEALEHGGKTALIENGEIVFYGIPDGGAEGLRKLMKHDGEEAAQ